MIYVVQAGNGPYKIGYTKDKKTFKYRLPAIQTHCAQEVRVLVLTHGNHRHEAMLHELLKQYRQEGEWFNDRDWMDPLMEHTITLLSQRGVNFVLSHTAEQIRNYCPIPGFGTIPYIDCRDGGQSNPQQYAGHTLQSWQRAWRTEMIRPGKA
jgi:hypothetical protein